MRKPDVVIGGADSPYLLRWHLIPRNRWFGIYLHKFLRDDDDRALHDHPKANISLIISGSYYEQMFTATPQEGKPLPETTLKLRKRFRLYPRRASTAHRVILPKIAGESIPCWSLFFTGPMIRSWGFWCPQGQWLHWKKFQGDSGSYETVGGPGCGA